MANDACWRMTVEDNFHTVTTQAFKCNQCGMVFLEPARCSEEQQVLSLSALLVIGRLNKV